MDTGVIVSAFAFDGVPEKAVRKAVAEASIYVSEELLRKYREVPQELESSGKIDHQQLKALLSGIAAFVARVRVVRVHRRFMICRDVKDNMLVECCHAAGADILITGDRDLLELNNMPFGLKVVTPRQYVGL